MTHILTIRNTPNLAGIEISGDYQDLDTLYLALLMIIGDEGDFPPYAGARIRILGMMYDIRHAFQGDREFEFVQNGMDNHRMKLLGLITPDKNLYYKANVYYPEALFVTMAINDFIRLYAKLQAKSSTYPLMDKKNLWDRNIATARLFQSLIVNCLEKAVTEASLKRIVNLLYKDYTWTDRYTTQYLDMVNIRYLSIEDKEERAKALTKTVKRMVEKGKEYQDIEENVLEMATANNCSTEEISLRWEYPEEIEW